MMSSPQPSVSIIIPAYNEEDHLAVTWEKTAAVLAKTTADYEIIIVDDGSMDRTAMIADGIQSRDSHVRVIHNPVNRGFGLTCREGIKAARMEYTGWISADTAWDPEVLKKVIGLLGQFDVITAYTLNSFNRPLFRRLISAGFTWTLNVLFGLRMRYFNGACVHRTALLQYLPLKSLGYTLWAEAIIRLVKAGYRCHEIGGEFDDRTSGRTKAFKFRNIIATLGFSGMMVMEIYSVRGSSPDKAGHYPHL